MPASNEGQDAANRFIESLTDLRIGEAAQEGPIAPPSLPLHITINRAVRCTIIIGHAPDACPLQSGRAARLGDAG